MILKKAKRSLTEVDLSTRYIWIVLLMVLTIHSSSLVAQTTPEYQVKAAFLYKFAAYVEWPPYAFANEDSPIVYGVIGADDLANTLAEIVKTRRVHNRNVEVRILESLEGSSGVHVLFVGRSERTDEDSRLLDTAITSVLTVTETTYRRSPGSIINFEIRDDRIQFDVSLDMAELANLRISSRLLQVAHRVINE